MDDNDEVTVGVTTRLYHTGGDGSLRPVAFNADPFTRNFLATISVNEFGEVEFELHLDQVDNPDAAGLSTLVDFLGGLLDVLDKAHPV